LFVPSNVKQFPINPVPVAVAPACKMPLLGLITSAAVPSPGHQPTTPAAAGEQLAAPRRKQPATLAKQSSAIGRWQPKGIRKCFRFLRSEAAFAGLVIEGS
jgi:hypothetical protein